MLKFDEIKVPEDASPSSGTSSYELTNSKPSPEGLHPTESTAYKVLQPAGFELKPASCSLIDSEHFYQIRNLAKVPQGVPRNLVIPA